MALSNEDIVRHHEALGTTPDPHIHPTAFREYEARRAQYGASTGQLLNSHLNSSATSSTNRGSTEARTSRKRSRSQTSISLPIRAYDPPTPHERARAQEAREKQRIINEQDSAYNNELSRQGYRYSTRSLQDDMKIWVKKSSKYPANHPYKFIYSETKAYKDIAAFTIWRLSFQAEERTIRDKFIFQAKLFGSAIAAVGLLNVFFGASTRPFLPFNHTGPSTSQNATANTQPTTATPSLSLQNFYLVTAPNGANIFDAPNGKILFPVANNTCLYVYNTKDEWAEIRAEYSDGAKKTAYVYKKMLNRAPAHLPPQCL